MALDISAFDPDAGEIRRTEFSVEGMHGALRSLPLMSYLERSGIELRELASHAAMRGRIAELPHLTYAQLVLNPSRFRVDRARRSCDRAVIVILISGSATITSGGAPVITRASDDGRIFYIEPGRDQVDIEFHEAVNKVFYVSFYGAPSVDVPRVVSEDSWGPFSSALLSPLVAFSARLCALSMMQDVDVSPLRQASEEVAVAMARVIAGEPERRTTLFDLAMNTIAREYANLALGPDSLARRLGVSTRTLQKSFQERDTTLASAIRQTRISVAVQLRHTNPRMAAGELAAAAGFGSKTTLYRALQAFHDATQDSVAPLAREKGLLSPERNRAWMEEQE